MPKQPPRPSQAMDSNASRVYSEGSKSRVTRRVSGTGGFASRAIMGSFIHPLQVCHPANS